jgi:hypothetical protein
LNSFTEDKDILSLYRRSHRRQLTVSYGEAVMLETIAVILIILWIFGLVSAYTLGGFIHILLVIAVVMVLLRIIQGRRIL